MSHYQLDIYTLLMQVLEKLEKKCADYDCVYGAITIQEKHRVKVSLVCSWLEHQRTQVTKVEACCLVSERQRAL